MFNVSEKMESIFPKELNAIIKEIGFLADETGMKAFLVGGLVRDLLLARRNCDLDIMIEGEGMKFAKTLKERLGGTLVEHSKFGTASLVQDWPDWLDEPLRKNDKFKIDIATARKESYSKPAVLPSVEFSSVEEDLYRRDFTINAMAININKEQFGTFIDFFNGQRDLKKRIIRALHDKSFIDDPTRIFRAVRFEQRLNFKIERHTGKLIKNAMRQEMFSETQNQRIRDELVLMMKEEFPEKAVARMRKLDELRFIDPDLVVSGSMRKMFADLRRHIEWYETSNANKQDLDIWLMNFMLVSNNLTKEQIKTVTEKFVFTRNESMKISFLKEHDKKIEKILSDKKDMLPSQIYEILKPLPHEVALCFMAKMRSPLANKRIAAFFETYDKVELSITGDELLKEGLPPGPRYMEVLRSILYAKLNGNILDRNDEMALLKELISPK